MNKPALPSKKAPVTILFDYFGTSFYEKIGRKYLFNYAKDGSLFKTILKSYSLEETKDLIDRYFASSDAFIAQTGYTVGVFRVKINSLLAGEGYRDAEEEAYFRDKDRAQYVFHNYQKVRQIKKATKNYKTSSPLFDKGYIEWAKEFEENMKRYPRILHHLEKKYTSL